MIDKRELLEKARERKLSLVMIEKDYVLGWLLFGFSRVPHLVFKGGTALSKVYFPETWRLSEDLDFSLLEGEWDRLRSVVPGLMKDLKDRSGIELRIAGEFSNPGYLQLRIQYRGPIGQNWAKLDVRKDDLVDQHQEREVVRAYSDYPGFTFPVESLEEICASKIRAVMERKKSRDYFDLWKLLGLTLDRQRVVRILPAKLAVKGLQLPSLEELLPNDAEATLQPYWERELGRLVEPVPDLKLVLAELRERLRRVVPESTER